MVEDSGMLEGMVSVGKVAAGSIPFTGVIKRMLGPAADELAERWRDEVRVYRYGRQLRMLEKAERMAKEAGFTPKAVPIKLLFPLLEGVSLEENEDLHTMWAALLANAANPDTKIVVQPGFISTLKQMSSGEAQLLKKMYEEVVSSFIDHDGIGFQPSAFTHHGFSFISPQDFRRLESSHYESDSIDTLVALNGLQANFLVERRFEDKGYDEYPPRNYYVTMRGYHFMLACNPVPKCK